MSLSICTYWEGPVSWLERVCINSMIDAGHEVEVFTSDVRTLKKTGLHHRITDIREVLEDSHPAYLYKSQQGGLRTFSDIARLAMLKKSRGVWCDADCLFIRPMIEGQDNFLGRLTQNRLSNGVLLLQPDSELLNRYYDAVSKVPLRAKWINPRLRFLREIEIIMGGAIPKHAGRCSIGPRAITYFVKQLKLEDIVLPPQVFFPIVQQEAHLLVTADAEEILLRISDETRMIHTWQSTLGHQGLLREKPGASSFLGKACNRLGV